MPPRSEAVYQLQLIQKLKKLFPGCYILNNDPHQFQGIPDLLLLYGNHWAMLEVKLSASACTQPNQQHYVDMFNDMSFCAFIYPEIEKKVLDDIQYAFGIEW